MANFLQNIAPGVANLTGGYLRGQRATEEKLREEEREREKDALQMYMKLIESGQWEAVDPKKGARDGAVLTIGGFAPLQPRKISMWDQAKYEQDQARMAHERGGWDVQAKEREAGRVESAKEREAKERQRKHDEEMQRLKLEEEKTKLSRLKSGTGTIREYTNQITGNKFKRTEAEMEYIATTPTDELSPEDKRIRIAMDMGKIDAGVPTKLTDTSMTEKEKLERETKNAESIHDLLVSVSNKQSTKEEIENAAVEINTLRLPDNATYVYMPQRQTKWHGGEDKPKLIKFNLPVVPLDDNSTRQLTIGDIRTGAKKRGISFEAALKHAFEYSFANKIGVAK